MSKYANELSIFHGSDTWVAVSKAIKLALKQPFGTFTSEEELDLSAVHAEMLRIEQGERHPAPTSYEARVCALEAEGMTTSDAQAVADAEALQDANS